MYEKTGNILTIARECNTAVIAFICQDYVMARSVVYAAQAVNTPAFVMLFPEHVTRQNTTGLRGVAELVKELANEVQVPIGLHLDHEYTYEAILNAINCGFESVMMDGSMKELQKNIQITKKVVEAAHKKGIIAEGEIGHVGLAVNADDAREDHLTKPEAAEIFCKESGVDLLAVSIGNAHGAYLQTPKLQIERLKEIRAVTKVPLVLHGGSGIPDDQLKEAFANGINKFNLGTEFLGNYNFAVQSFIEMNRKDKDPVKIIHMPEYVQSKLQPYLEERMKTLCHF